MQIRLGEKQFVYKPSICIGDIINRWSDMSHSTAPKHDERTMYAVYRTIISLCQHNPTQHVIDWTQL